MGGENFSIERKSRNLEMLYDVVASINLSHDLTELLTRSLGVLVESNAARAAMARLLEPHGVLRLVGDIGFAEALPVRRTIGSGKTCVCRKAIDHGHIQMDYSLDSCCGGHIVDANNKGETALLCVPLQYRSRSFGVINLHVDKARLDEDEDLIVFLTSVGQHLGMAIERVGVDRETERLSRVEERAHLAHELHDSLAQTLASVRLQIRLLRETLSLGDITATQEKMGIVEDSVEQAYKELRDLIARFRIPVKDTSVGPSIENVVTRFKQESGIPTYFHNEWGDTELPGAIEAQVIRIIQEALNNSRKHSEARMVRVLMRRVDSQQYQVLIEDDGKGFSNASRVGAPGEHLGLSIMRERAEKIGGKLKIDSEATEGTRVRLTFPYLPPITEDVYSEPQQ